MSEKLELIPQNPFTMAARENTSATEAQLSRQAQEVQAAMVIAKKFPRDPVQAWARIMQSCERTTLAESAIYSYPKGGTTVSGPSIRLAECMAQNWGNIDFGVIELSQKGGESEVMSYAWDLETNTRQTKVFTVKHQRKSRGEIKQLDDPRDIYEMVSNQGARRLRACILGVIPGDVQDSAVKACEKTLAGSSKEPLIDRAKKMLSAFGEMGVNQAMIEGRLGHKLDVISEVDLVNLRKIYTSLKDNFGKVTDYFDYVEPITSPNIEKPKRKPRSDIGKKRSEPEPAPDTEPATETTSTAPDEDEVPMNYTPTTEQTWTEILAEKVSESRVDEFTMIVWLQSQNMIAPETMKIADLEEVAAKRFCAIFDSIAKQILSIQ